MDIRHFVNFKKVPGGQRHESRIVGGIGFTKNVVHKDMAASIDQPRVLLLKCAIVYQRVEGKFVSIETLLLQETEYLRNVTSRILQLRPNVVLVHRNVAGIAQDMLRAHGITLVLDVKLSVLERLARSLGCDIVESIDSNVGRPKLGTCHRFYTALFENCATGSRKALIFFELQSLQRGCCVLLRGTDSELVRVKQVARLLLYARYNWRLELALLLDEFARPPSPKASIFDSKDQSPVLEANAETELGVESSDKRKSTVCTVKLDRRSTELALECSKVVNKENVQDFSDPLRAIDLSPGTYDQESSVKFAVETPFDNRFRTTLSSTVLSVSPFVAFPLPYLETEAGRKCALRSRFPQDLYYSNQWSGDGKLAPITIADGCGVVESATQPIGVPFGESHEFLSHNITTSINNGELQAMWANFRASGGRLPQPPVMGRIASRKETIPAEETAVAASADATAAARIDALSIVNHQRLPVLFCSFYTHPKPATTYCAPPSLLRMTFYGEQDIMLGQFLEHYCFRRSYMCPSCNLPMLSHVRRFVHSLGCVQVKLIEDDRQQNNSDILMTSWCSICHSWTPSVPISVDTWCLSFAKYLEHRFHSHAYRRNAVDATTAAGERSDSEGTPVPCTHSMHRDYVHYFSHNNIVASFAYSPIECWSISLPATVRMLATVWHRHDDTDGGPNERHAEEIKELAQSGYEVFARIYERLATVAGDSDVPALTALKLDLNRDQFAFRDRVGWVQTLLTSGTEGTASVWEVQDAMWSVKQTLAKNIEQWSLRLADASNAAVAIVAVASSGTGAGHHQRVSAAIDAGTICTEDLQPDSPDLTAAPPSPFIQRRTSREIDGSPIVSNHSPTKLHPNAPDAVKETSAVDKKSVKTLLRELLPSEKPTAAASNIPSPLSASEHFGLSIGGRFPVTVHDQDVSSVIAFALVSHDYKRALDLRQQQLQSHVAQNAPDGTASASVSVLPMSTPSTASPNLEGDTEQRFEPPEKKRNSSAAAHIEVAFNVSIQKSGNVSCRNKNSNYSTLQDISTSFTCKTYFAHEFDTLRASLISDKPTQTTNMTSPSREPTSNGSCVDDLDQVRDVFARSLCRSVQWEARGGKSGSKFCKTMGV